MNAVKRLWPIIGLLTLVGCAPIIPAWVNTDQPYSNEEMSFSVELPKGWMRYTRGEGLLMTRDGIPLQYISIERSKIGEPLKFTKKTLKKEMMPQEVSEVYLDNAASNPQVLGMKTEKNSPATISGHSGFKATYVYKNSDGLRYKTMVYGFLKEDWFYTILFSAPQRHYFDKDIKTFEKVFESFKLKDKSA